MKGRLSGETDAYGNVNPNFGKDNNLPKRMTPKEFEEIMMAKFYNRKTN